MKGTEVDWNTIYKRAMKNLFEEPPPADQPKRLYKPEKTEDGYDDLSQATCVLRVMDDETIEKKSLIVKLTDNFRKLFEK